MTTRRDHATRPLPPCDDATAVERQFNQRGAAEIEVNSVAEFELSTNATLLHSLLSFDLNSIPTRKKQTIVMRGSYVRPVKDLTSIRVAFSRLLSRYVLPPRSIFNISANLPAFPADGSIPFAGGYIINNSLHRRSGHPLQPPWRCERLSRYRNRLTLSPAVQRGRRVRHALQLPPLQPRRLQYVPWR